MAGAALISKAETQPQAVPRKKPQSVRLDSRFWTQSTPPAKAAVRTAHPQLLPQLAQLLLPQPNVVRNRWELVTNVLADFTLVFVNYVAASHFHLAIRHNLLWLTRVPAMPPAWRGFVLLYGTLITLLAYSEGLYATDRTCLPREETLVLARVVSWATVLSVTLIHLFRVDLIPFGAMAGSAILNLITMGLRRKAQRGRATQEANSGHAKRNVLIVGAGTLGRQVADYLTLNPQMGRIVRGFLDDKAVRDRDVLGNVDDLERIARAEFADEIIITLPQERDVARRVIQQARTNRMDVRVVPDLLGLEAQIKLSESYGALPVVTLHEESIPAGRLSLKRVFDVVGSLLGLLLTAPLWVAIALAIRLDSVGPIFYCAPRAGRKGTCFLCAKFRTMKVNAPAIKESLRAQNEREGPFFKVARDPRITRVGRFLRRASLDELPQLWNVLKGEMSLVGPRPHPLDDFSRYELEHLRRLNVTPGVTGLWQVTARQDPSFLRNMTLDLEYIEHWSLWMDIRILMKTFAAVLKGSGA